MRRRASLVLGIAAGASALLRLSEAPAYSFPDEVVDDILAISAQVVATLLAAHLVVAGIAVGKVESSPENLYSGLANLAMMAARGAVALLMGAFLFSLDSGGWPWEQSLLLCAYIGLVGAHLGTTYQMIAGMVDQWRLETRLATVNYRLDLP